MKMAVTIEFDVDLGAWGDAYDVRGVEIKPDVAGYLNDLLQHCPAAVLGLLSDITVRRVVERRS